MEKAPSDARLREIASRRLRAMGVMAYSVGDQLQGRLDVVPGEFAKHSNVAVDAAQHFVVHGHAFLAFLHPSPLRHLGGVRFYEQPDIPALHRLILERWQRLMVATQQALDRAREYLPRAALDRETWTICAVEGDRDGDIGLRFDGRITQLQVISVDGIPITDLSSETFCLDLSPSMAPLRPDMILPLLQKARACRRAKSLESDRDQIDLGDFTLLSIPPAGASEAPTLVNLDLEQLKTGDLSVLPSQPPATEPEPARPSIPLPKRQRRVPLQADAIVTTAAGQLSVRIANVSAGGLFVGLASGTPPPIGESVKVGGFGPLAAYARVAHHRPLEEGTLFGTGAGMGLAFLELERDHRWGSVSAAQEGSWALMVSVEDAHATRSLIESGHQIICVDNLAAAAIAAHLFRFDRVVGRAEDHDTIRTALALQQRGIELVTPEAL